jgi:ribosomal protein S18 acetylase RimI-like enzyme
MKSWQLVAFQYSLYLCLLGSNAFSLGFRKDPDMPTTTNNQPIRVFRSLREPGDQALVWQFLMHAAQESDLEEVKRNPLLQPYAQNFGEQKGDIGVVALEQRAGGEEPMAIGAAWVRFLPGVGFATAHLKKDDDNEEFQVVHGLPELAISCLPEYRGRGVGSSLLRTLCAKVQETSNYQGIVLSCRDNNPALRLYERVGFVKVEGSDHGNRTGGISLTMKYMFEQDLHK